MPASLAGGLRHPRVFLVLGPYCSIVYGLAQWRGSLPGATRAKCFIALFQFFTRLFTCHADTQQVEYGLDGLCRHHIHHDVFPIALSVP